MKYFSCFSVFLDLDDCSSFSYQPRPLWGVFSAMLPCWKTGALVLRYTPFLYSSIQPWGFFRVSHSSVSLDFTCMSKRCVYLRVFLGFLFLLLLEDFHSLRVTRYDFSLIFWNWSGAKTHLLSCFQPESMDQINPTFHCSYSRVFSVLHTVWVLHKILLAEYFCTFKSGIKPVVLTSCRSSSVLSICKLLIVA